MDLSILICHIPERIILLDRLLDQIHLQIKNAAPDAHRNIEIITDRGSEIVGKKRNNLLTKAKGRFIVFIDDDDEIMAGYISHIYSTIKANPEIDCIGISGIMTTNGKDQRNWHISKEYGSWYEQDSVYYRTPNHISPVRAEIAKQVGFPEKAFSEDYEYSMGILPFLKNEVKIAGPIYHYKFMSK